MKTTLSHKLMNHHLQRMAYYAQNVADELGLPRRGIPA